ncbi:hypothetical protein [Phytoactinopolyspora limicola]|uniref:hypothetical protein n=1 Tax=Phytoactinopolyspora limicola TaxID=2715536 RepID=UPI00140C86C3|nr:hypothetical protein [Phytoactinopolyspora limicola]
MRSTYQRTALSLAAAALAVAGCSNNETDDDGERAASGPLAEFMNRTPATAGLSGRGSGITDNHPEPSAEEIRQQHHMEELVADCMRDAGFEYVPRPVKDDEDSGPAQFDEAYALEPADFAEQYGYGITTIFYNQANNLPEGDDPNADIRDALSEAARDAYDDALWGRRDEESGDRDNSGCYDQAHAETVDTDEPNLDDVSQEFDPLFDDVEALFERVRNDPRVTALVGEWQECMADQGFAGLEELDDPYMLIEDKTFEASVPEDEAPATMGDDGGVIVEGDSRSIIAPEKLKELRKHEIELATADFGCREQHEDDYRTVALELEEEFVDAHRDELERYRDFLHGSGDS